jgi:hypothetical protein
MAARTVQARHLMTFRRTALPLLLQFGCQETLGVDLQTATFVFPQIRISKAVNLALSICLNAHGRQLL